MTHSRFSIGLAAIGFLAAVAIAPAIENGQVVQGAISLPGEQDQHTFSGAANDTVQIRVARANGDSDVWPEIDLFDPDGLIVTSKYGAVSLDVMLKLHKSGTYTIVCKDGFDGTSTGSYNVSLTILNGHNRSVFPCALPSRWVCVMVWDSVASQWLTSEDQFAPTETMLTGVQPNIWYWIGVWDYNAGAWAFGDWYLRIE